MLTLGHRLAQSGAMSSKGTTEELRVRVKETPVGCGMSNMCLVGWEGTKVEVGQEVAQRVQSGKPHFIFLSSR